MSAAGLPSVPDQFKVYDSYTIDPKYSRYFTYGWLGSLALALLFSGSFLVLIRSFRSGRFFCGWFIDEDLSPRRKLPSLDQTLHQALLKAEDGDSSRSDKTAKRRGSNKRVLSANQAIVNDGLASAGRLVPTTLGGGGPEVVYRMISGIVYLGIVLLCVLKDAQLSSNPNRFGFLTLAQLTPLFLLSTKNNPLAFILSTGYEKINWAHRWLGRTVWLTATCHGAMWAYKHGRQYTLSNQKTRWGLAVYSFLCLSALTSIKPIRSKCYTLFWIAHMMSIIGFFATIAYHTPFAQPWIYPPIALYAFDLCARLVKLRFKDAELIPLEGMTLIHIPHATHGWLPGQHVYLRIFTSNWSALEPAHPFTILSPPRRPSQTDSSAVERGDGLILLAGCSGNWTRSIHSLARTGQSSCTKAVTSEDSEKTDTPGVAVSVMLDGPYGSFGAHGLSEEKAEVVICIAGGSGVSFLIALAEEARAEWAAIGSRARSGVKVIELIWVVRTLAMYTSLEALLSPLLSSRVRLSVYLTQSPPPTANEDAPTVRPYTTLHFIKPDLGATLRTLMDEHAPVSGVSVRACGPSGLVRQVERSVGELGRAVRTEVGGISFEAESFNV
ncbi:Ferric reductase, NADH/NADPH oxidase and related proteins [Phaffia rhodozyma]|uniref:Ferric reductase, NADH/NADPH oxidase and related proteins n=1 Tax=Phaffia rhodozyma TaxID=264483 RepID=A0A0F7SL82_PHARH|nr:Ferric reductase, NADH/NADPH oxidase and related proteins [Phaffia rhodozyma]